MHVHKIAIAHIHERARRERCEFSCFATRQCYEEAESTDNITKSLRHFTLNIRKVGETLKLDCNARTHARSAHKSNVSLANSTAQHLISHD